MNKRIILIAFVLLAFACSHNKNGDVPTTDPTMLDRRVPSIIDEPIKVQVPEASENAVPAAEVAGNCQTLDSQGLVTSCVDYPLNAYTLEAAQTGCSTSTADHRFTAALACTHTRASGGCVSAASRTITWFYLLPDESPGNRPTPSCDDGQLATPP